MNNLSILKISNTSNTSNVNKYITINCIILLKLQFLVYHFHYDKGIKYNIITKYLEENNDKLINFLLSN